MKIDKTVWRVCVILPPFVGDLAVETWKGLCRDVKKGTNGSGKTCGEEGEEPCLSWTLPRK
jgi:hypothetical protein